MNKLAALLLLGFARAALASGGDVDPIGPLPSTAPAIPMHAFAAGHLGIIDGEFQRAYLVAAWRAIGGKPLEDAQVKQLALALKAGTEGDYDTSGFKAWADALAKFGPKAGIKPPPGYIDETRQGRNASAARLLDADYDNCSDAGGRTAAATLAARAQAYGQADASPWVAEWVFGQQAVFANCNYGSGMPPPAADKAPAWLKQDRAYQIASAHFYRGEFELARDGFAKIAADAASPWQPWGAYLVARSDLRLGSLAADEAVRKAALARADNELRALADGKSEALRNSVHALQARLAIERDRAGTFAALDRQVGEGAWGPRATAQIGDFLTLVRQPVWRRSVAAKPDGQALEARRDGSLADWLAAMYQSGIVGMSAYYAPAAPMSDAERARICGALSVQGPHRNAWMLACYLSAPRLADVPAQVQALAAALPDTDPAWATITYLDLRLQMREREAQPAAVDAPKLRARLDAAIARGDAMFGADGINALRLLRAPLSTSTLDFVTTSAIRDLPDPPRYAWFEEVAREPSTTETMHPDVARMLTTSVPTGALADLAENAHAAKDVRANALQSAWTRAAVLGQDAVVARLTPALAKARPHDAPDITAVVAEADPIKKRYLLARLMHRANLSPTYPGASSDEGLSFDPGWRCKYPSRRTSLAWLSADEDKAATGELAALTRLPTATTFYGQATLAWAEKSPTDPRLATDLADVVAATRLGCPGETGVSKAAFKALHKLFPKSPEARRTKYWF